MVAWGRALELVSPAFIREYANGGGAVSATQHHKGIGQQRLSVVALTAGSEVLKYLTDESRETSENYEQVT